MNAEEGQSLERALSRTEGDALATIKAANSVVGVLKKLHRAACQGNLHDMQFAIDTADKALVALREQFTNAKQGWAFDAEGHMSDGSYAKEVVAAGLRAGVRISERDGLLYCYPSLVEISAKDGTVRIDKKRQRRIRPSVLVARLQEAQRKPARFRSETVLAGLFDAYSNVLAMRRKDTNEAEPVVPLRAIYRLLTLRPGQEQEYPRQEFAQDIYRLHRSGVDTLKDGTRIAFHRGSGRTPSQTISIVNEAGDSEQYYGISFTQPAKERQS